MVRMNHPTAVPVRRVPSGIRGGARTWKVDCRSAEVEKSGPGEWSGA